MKRHVWALSVTTLIAVVMSVAWARAAFGFGPYPLNGPRPLTDVTLGQATRGVVFGTAAINADGTIAKCFNCSSSTHLIKGQYQVTFGSLGNITATNGFSRWVQVDSLSTGVAGGVTCTTADRFGNTSAILVACFNGSGAFTDTSFFLFVAR